MSPIQVDAQVVGADSVVRFMKGLSQDVQKRVMRSAMREAGNLIRDDARKRVPVDTGTLRRNIVTDVRQTRRGIWIARVGVGRRGVRQRARLGGLQALNQAGGGLENFVRGKNRALRQEAIPYGYVVEFGSSTQPARPFLRPAFMENRHKITERFRRGIAKAIERQRRKLPRGRLLR